MQLAPAYTGGARLADGAVLPAADNATPIEVDQLYESITELSTALGPDGANTDGALAGLLDTGAKNLDGNGEGHRRHHRAVRQGDEDPRQEQRRPLRHLSSTCRPSPPCSRRTTATYARPRQQLNTVTGFLADDKENLGAALKELGKALGQVKGFIQRNRGALKENVDLLLPLTQTLVDQRASLAESLDTLPLAAGNV